MDQLFGISMDAIMAVLAAMFAVSVASVAYIFITSRVMFRMGVRNLRRRGLQSGLVVLGLMLATLITTAAFTTGDTVDHSIARAGYEQFQRTDLQLNFVGEREAFTNDVAVYFDEDATEAMEARFAGDPDIEGFIPLLQEPATVVNPRTGLSEASVVLSGIDPERIDRLGGLRRAGGGTVMLASIPQDALLLSERAAEKLRAEAGDTLTVYVGGVPTEVRVADIVQDELVTSGSRAFYEKGSGGAAIALSSVQRITGHEGQLNRLNIALHGDVATSHLRSDAAISRLEPFLASEEGRALLAVEHAVTVDAVKADAIQEAEEQGNLFTTFFLMLGLFSIAAGVMLIFMIFVMLATERKAEMGMARAVGAQRGSLMRAFVAEGMAYSLVAGAVGTLAGVAAAVGLVAVFLRVAGGFDFIEAHITLRSLVISYCLGVVITFLTVVVSAYKVSAVNIVAAIRGTDEDEGPQRSRRTSWRWVVAGIPALVVPPVGIWFLVRKGFGVSWAWIVAPVGIVLGGLSIVAASGTDSEFLFSFGVSILPLSAAALAAHYRAPRRPTWTLVGAYLAAYWLAPLNYDRLLLGKDLTGGLEMFVLSGVMVVIAFTVIIVFNAQLLTAIVQRGSAPRYTATFALAALTLACVAVAVAVGDQGNGLGQLLYLFAAVLGIGAATALAAVRFPHLAPALKMGVAYPLSNRFRTGMTIAMFSLIVFSLATFSALNSSFVAMLTAEGGDGGWDVLVTANRNAALSDVPAALEAERAAIRADIETAGRTTIFTGRTQVRIVGHEYGTFPVLAADDAFLAMPEGRLTGWADGYEDEAAAFAAVRSDPALALVDPSVLPDGFNEYGFNIADLEVKDDRFAPFELEVTDVASGKSTTVTVVGVLAIQVDSSYTAGVYVNEDAYRATFGTPDYLRTYVRLDDSVSPRDGAEAIEGALVRSGVQAESIRTLLDEAAAEQNTFMRMFQGFMALGLFTGIAALGVVAFRSVVERRQQIGMLRAIGYQDGTVALTFLLESGFIALMGILSGVVGGMVIARNVLTSGQFGGTGFEFVIPWAEVTVIALFSFAVAMAMTWWPSRVAAAVPVADALRYE
ncbi:MAG: ABC transporter permease [Dehalococcoidia bacterium]